MQESDLPMRSEELQRKLSGIREIEKQCQKSRGFTTDQQENQAGTSMREDDGSRRKRKGVS